VARLFCSRKISAALSVNITTLSNSVRRFAWDYHPLNGFLSFGAADFCEAKISPLL